jgi:hypothetical protein
VGMAKSAKEWQKAGKEASEEIRRELLIHQIKEISTLFHADKSEIGKDELPSVIEDMDRYYTIINKILDIKGHKTTYTSELEQLKKLTEEDLEQYQTVLEFKEKVKKANTKWKVLEKLGDKYKGDVKPFKGIWAEFEEKLATLGEKK